ncbi:MAG: hypothetical protein KDG52_16860 [Rhodocyclaceae bacterium]|nr:hypothetical protein [Rhodocyclaceae bacterium]
MSLSTELRVMLSRLDELARSHCGMPVDVPRLLSNAAYRETVFRVVETARHGELKGVAVAVREALAQPHRPKVFGQ